MRTTKSRTQLKNFFEAHHGAFTAQQIHDRLPEFDLATIYRNLNRFVEESIIKELRLHRGESMYELNHDGHDHAVCENCGEVRHFKLDKEKIMHLIDVADFEIEDVEIIVKGKCK